MAKMRNYTYGSPKFEGEINKAISDAASGGKLYLHKVFIYAAGEDDSQYYYGIDVYSTDATPLFTMETPTSLADVIAFITPYLNIMTHSAPSYVTEACEYTLTIQNNVLKGISIAYADLQQVKKPITAIIMASDTVIEV